MHKFLELYEYVLKLANHAKAKYYLFFLSVAESSFFPIPPDVMLLPMCLSNPKKAWKFAFITTVGSVLGGIIGYLIGVYAFGFIEPYLYDWGYMPAYEMAVMWFEEWGFWAIFIAGFSPIPYKVFTIAGGALLMPILPFILASIIGRGARFYLVALFVVMFGKQADKLIRKHMTKLVWGMVLLIIFFLLIFKI
jgi:membrane protein YqaA with SNARE-associated domain